MIIDRSFTKASTVDMMEVIEDLENQNLEVIEGYTIHQVNISQEVIKNNVAVLTSFVIYYVWNCYALPSSMFKTNICITCFINNKVII